MKVILPFIALLLSKSISYSQFSINDKWGLFLHYVPDSAMFRFPEKFDATVWNKWVKDVDVKALAKQIDRIGPDYVFITVGHHAGYFCSPNKTMDSIVGRFPSRCSERDLVLDLANELQKYKIKLGAYIQSRAPDGDTFAVNKLNWKLGNFRNADFQTKWEKIIEEYSMRWGDKIFSWWVDCAYFPDSMYLGKTVPNQFSLEKSFKAGNSNVELCFNPGTRTQLKPHLPIETYSAGEMDYFLNVSGKRPLDGKWFNTSEMMKGKRTFFLTFSGQWWGWGNPRFPDELIIGYTKHIIRHGGLMTWDVPINSKGKIPEANFQQMRKLKNIE